MIVKIDNTHQGVVERNFYVTIFDDNTVEEDEVFQLVLEVPEGILKKTQLKPGIVTI